MSRESLRERLSRINRSSLLAEIPDPGSRSEATPTSSDAGDPEARAARIAVPVGMQELLPGRVLSGEHGSFFLHERPRSAVTPDGGAHVRRCIEAAKGAGIVEREGVGEAFVLSMEEGLEHAVFLDLETAGFAGATLFLAGTMHFSEGDFHLRQYFARDYSEEKALVAGLLGHLAVFRTLFTYNGKSFDLPFLLDRAAFHRLPVPRLPSTHLDLLHPSRRRFKARLPNCRLQTLEWYLARRRRSGDVPGIEIPGLYHRYVRQGDPYPMIGIFHHNLLDLLAMSEILLALLSDDREEGSW